MCARAAAAARRRRRDGGKIDRSRRGQRAAECAAVESHLKRARKGRCNMLGRMRVGAGGLAVLLAIVAVTATSGEAGIVVTSRESSLAASGQVTGDQFDLTDSSTSLGSYDNTIGDSLPGANDGGTASASASQTSNITATSIAGQQTGSASAQVAELDAIAAQAQSLLDVAFDVVGLPEAVTIQGHVESTFDAAARVTLSDAGGTIFERFVDIGSQDRIEFDESLTLEPGSYTLVAEARVTGTPAPNAADFEMTIAHAVIPLPAPILGGAVMLLLASWRGRREL
jgi:hypothetical protein